MSHTFIVTDINSEDLLTRVKAGEIDGISFHKMKEGDAGLVMSIDPKSAVKRQVELARLTQMPPDTVVGLFPHMDSVYGWLGLEKWKHSTIDFWGANTSMVDVFMDRFINGLNKLGYPSRAVSEHDDEFEELAGEGEGGVSEAFSRKLDQALLH
jgi:hypothetical protein